MKGNPSPRGRSVPVARRRLFLASPQGPARGCWARSFGLPSLNPLIAEESNPIRLALFDSFLMQDVDKSRDLHPFSRLSFRFRKASIATMRNARNQPCPGGRAGCEDRIPPVESAAGHRPKPVEASHSRGGKCCQSIDARWARDLLRRSGTSSSAIELRQSRGRCSHWPPQRRRSGARREYRSGRLRRTPVHARPLRADAEAALDFVPLRHGRRRRIHVEIRGLR